MTHQDKREGVAAMRGEGYFVNQLSLLSCSSHLWPHLWGSYITLLSKNLCRANAQMYIICMLVFHILPCWGFISVSPGLAHRGSPKTVLFLLLPSQLSLPEGKTASVKVTLCQDNSCTNSQRDLSS